MTEESSFRQAKHHWIEVWVKGVLLAFGCGVATLALGDLWSGWRLFWKICLLTVSLCISALVCWGFYVHHYELQKKADEIQGLKRMKI